jgi:hypothetical protein
MEFDHLKPKLTENKSYEQYLKEMKAWELLNVDEGEVPKLDESQEVVEQNDTDRMRSSDMQQSQMSKKKSND